MHMVKRTEQLRLLLDALNFLNEGLFCRIKACFQLQIGFLVPTEGFWEKKHSVPSSQEFISEEESPV